MFCHLSKSGKPVSEHIKQREPEEKTGAFADEHEEGAAAEMQLVEAQAYGEDIAHERQPCQEGQQGTVPVYLRLLFQQGLLLDVEPLLYPFPFADTAYPVGGQTSQPVAGSSAEPRYHRVSSGQKYTYYKKVRRKRDDGGGHESSDEKADVAEVEQKVQVHRLSPYLFEKFCHDSAALLRHDSFYDFCPWMQQGRGEQGVATLGVIGSVDYRSDLGPGHRGGAHRARLDSDVKGAFREIFAAYVACGCRHGQHLGMGRGVVQGLGLVVRPGDDPPLAYHHRSDGDLPFGLSPPRLLQGLAHIFLVVSVHCSSIFSRIRFSLRQLFL